ncbi:MAG TPA: NAD(P)/FAD-dependent oxidoreductase [Vicinamibacterales bacterium]|nr:NAD(P)/FAD-dependent oxidoreductase [Vicinamibacterales bacterium]
MGAGPNGLAAGIALARAGRRVRVIEAEAEIGGGLRSAALTRPGFVHDLCAAVFPLAVASPFLQTLPLHAHGLAWVHPAAPLAHPFDDGSAVVVWRSIEQTAAGLGPDAGRYRRLVGPLLEMWPRLARTVLSPRPLPRDPRLLARFAVLALGSAAHLASRFRTARARALLAGLAAHSLLPLEATASAAFALVLLGSAHAVGWPFARGGSQALADALAGVLRAAGGELQAGTPVGALDELPPAPAILCDVAPRELARLAGTRLPPAYRRRLERYRHGPGVYKMDWALETPIPWRAPECLSAGTVHLGGDFDEIAAAERAAWSLQPAARPFVILAQPTLFDPTRAPAGRHTAWAYCHVPNGWTGDLTGAIEDQIERFAPGFRARILARAVAGPGDLERRNRNLVGGDIAGGANRLRQILARPTPGGCRTPVRGLYLCSASTPPGGGVHGMCGYHAAQRALEEVLGR